MKRLISILAVTAALLLAAIAASPVGAGRSEVIGVTAIVPGKDLVVHILALVPPGSSRSEVTNRVLAEQGARAITKAEYSLTGLVWDQFGDGNPGNDFVTQYYNGADDPTSGNALAELLASQNTWNAVASSNFHLSDGGPTDPCPSLVKECKGRQYYDGNNDVSWIKIRDANTLGVTWYGNSSSGAEADMALNTNFTWNIGSDYDIQTVSLHENGHVAGLGHTDVGGAIMEAVYAGVTQDLHADDILGISELYPSGTPPEPGVLETIEVTPADSSVTVGGTQQYTATGHYDNGTNADITDSVTWASSNTAVATIDAAGLATGVALGSTSISASHGEIGSTAVTLSVEEGPPAGSVATVTGVDHRFSGGGSGDKDLRITVHVADDLGSPVEGASVTVWLTNDTSGGAWTGTASTNADGSVSFHLRNAPAGCYSTEVTNVTAAGLTWDEYSGPFAGECKLSTGKNNGNSGSLVSG
ncbi:MAG TPA: proprotein convertase P [Dehalococcoidia bacterium]|nr:proprotein convertase P [Dehalococcoidia bacterium]